MRVHFIAIGGSAMHNLAIALHKKGVEVSGSDDEIFEPSKSRLANYGLLPGQEGWDASRITHNLDAVILGMHAKADNPELLEAKRLGITIFSYPEYLYEQSKNKKRVVIGGSHGKTTITAMILHVLQVSGIDCDYMVGAQLEGFEVMVKLSETAPVMIIEGDEYLTSPIDLRPKFHLYHPDIALLSGIAWDHINVFPTFENYLDQFRIFINKITPGGTLIYCSEDKTLQNLCDCSREDISIQPYDLPQFTITHGQTSLLIKDQKIPLQIFGKHNLLNVNGARLICNQLGVDDATFYSAIQSFKGASKRLEVVAKNEHTIVFKDFAHAPSKVSATLTAVREQFPDRKVVACLELHTFSSLSKDFLDHYKGTLDNADLAMVYFSPHALQLKRLPTITNEQVSAGFGKNCLEVYTDSKKLLERLYQEDWKNTVLLMMSSGNYDGIDLKLMADQICG
ncbi:MAG: Mur ligase family protein [Bacteroidales bacterium]|nr:Mur ligase family protein [Bacteroidales bacterium]MDD4604336.1 Mur ligase family protein [Bacteroidales bacterium]